LHCILNSDELILVTMRDREKTKPAFKALNLVDQICRALRDNILSGRLKGGQQLLEDQIKNEYGISRTPLREAFRVLEKEGLVEIVPRKGTFVKGITRQDIEAHFPIRAILEGLAARLACSNLTQEDLSEMEDLFQSMKTQRKKRISLNTQNTILPFMKSLLLLPEMTL